MPRARREWNRARLVHPMLYSHLTYILFTAFFSKSTESLSGALGRVLGVLPGLHEALPALGSFPRTCGGAWGRMVAVSGTCRGHIRVYGPPVRQFGRLLRDHNWQELGAGLHALKQDSAPGIKLSLIHI